jgi:hypothetical protein
MEQEQGSETKEERMVDGRKVRCGIVLLTSRMTSDKGLGLGKCSSLLEMPQCR